MWPPKAISVTPDGEPDGWVPPRAWRVQVAPDGSTRLVVSVPAAELPEVHLRLLAVLGTPLSLRYLQLTDRRRGQLPRPRSFVRMEAPAAHLLAGLQARGALVWGDGRHQLWIRGRLGEQVVLDELGVLYCYPDDPAFREALGGIDAGEQLGLDGRDYVKVMFLAEADAEEAALLAELREIEGPTGPA